MTFTACETFDNPAAPRLLHADGDNNGTANGGTGGKRYNDNIPPAQRLMLGSG